MLQPMRIQIINKETGMPWISAFVSMAIIKIKNLRMIETSSHLKAFGLNVVFIKCGVQ